MLQGETFDLAVHGDVTNTSTTYANFVAAHLQNQYTLFQWDEV